MAHLPVTRLLLKTHRDLKQEDRRVIGSILSESPGIGAVEVDWDRDLIACVTAAQDDGAELRKRLTDHGYAHDVITGDQHSTERGLSVGIPAEGTSA